MKTLKKVFSLLPLLALWLLMSVFLWGFVFDKLTDTSPEHKLTLCVDAPTPGAVEMAAVLEDELAGAVRMVKVRPFSYAMFNADALTAADLFLAPASRAEEYADWFSPLPEEWQSAENCLLLDGAPFGLPFHAPGAGGAAEAYIDFDSPEAVQDTYYLFFGKKSLHTQGNENAVDTAAHTAARLLLDMR